MKLNPNKNKLREDQVELPKINFIYANGEQKSRKYSDVNIKLPEIEENDEEEQARKTHAIPSESNESDYFEDL